MSKYDLLANYLATLDIDEVVLEFGDIERIIGSELPPSAREHLAWWANSRTQDSHTWAHKWQLAGWESRNVDLRNLSVTFKRFEFYHLDSHMALEGYEIDLKILAKTRNAALALDRKKKDNYTCQACHFHLEFGGSYIIEVHHLHPIEAGERESFLEDLVSLCPTCHRIAHLRNEPYGIAQIQYIRKNMANIG